jgi:hypothetical protein
MYRLRQLKVSIDADIAEEFKAACAVRGESMAARITALIRAEVGSPFVASSAHPSVSTRRQRRQAAHRCAKEVERILDAEEAYRGRIPENLSSGEAYCAAEEAVAALGEAAELLYEAL